MWPPVVDHTPVVGPTPLSIWASLIGLSELFLKGGVGMKLGEELGGVRGRSEE